MRPTLFNDIKEYVYAEANKKCNITAQNVHNHWYVYLQILL